MSKLNSRNENLNGSGMEGEIELTAFIVERPENFSNDLPNTLK
jgi:hypothetical protein